MFYNLEQSFDFGKLISITQNASKRIVSCLWSKRHSHSHEKNRLIEGSKHNISVLTVNKYFATKKITDRSLTQQNDHVKTWRLYSHAYSDY